MGSDCLSRVSDVTLKNLPKLKSLSSQYSNAEASDEHEAPMNADGVVIEGLPALEVVHLNGTALLNGGEIVFQNLPKLQKVEVTAASACNITAVTFRSVGVSMCQA